MGGLVLGWFGLVGTKIQKVRGNAADVHDAADIFLYRDSSVAPLLDMCKEYTSKYSKFYAIWLRRKRQQQHEQ